jgi:hypothetical protein
MRHEHIKVCNHYRSCTGSGVHPLPSLPGLSLRQPPRGLFFYVDWGNMPRHGLAAEHTPLVITVEQALAAKAKGTGKVSRERRVLHELRRMRRGI